MSLLGSTGGNTVVMPATGQRAMSQLQNNILTHNTLPSGQSIIKKNKSNNNSTADAQNMQQNNMALLAPLGINIQRTVSNDSFVPPLNFDPNGLSTIPIDPIVTEANCDEQEVAQQSEFKCLCVGNDERVFDGGDELRCANHKTSRQPET